MSKLEAIFLALCNSPIIALRLHFTEIFDVQCTDSFFILWFTWVVILPLFQIISVSRILVGSNSNASFIFWCYKFNALQSSSVSFFFFWNRYHPDNSCRKEILKVPLYPFPSCKHRYPKEQQISVLPLDSHQFVWLACCLQKKRIPS